MTKSKPNSHEIEWEFYTFVFVIFTRVKLSKVPNLKCSIMFLDFCVFDVLCSDLPAYSTEKKKTTHWTVVLIRWAEGDTFSTLHRCVQKYNMTQHRLKANLVHFCFSVFLFLFLTRSVCLSHFYLSRYSILVSWVIESHQTAGTLLCVTHSNFESNADSNFSSILLIADKWEQFLPFEHSDFSKCGRFKHRHVAYDLRSASFRALYQILWQNA